MEVKKGEDGDVIRCEWVEHSASIPIEASADELFVYYSDLENLPKWFVCFAHFCVCVCVVGICYPVYPTDLKVCDDFCVFVPPYARVSHSRRDKGRRGSKT